MQLGRDERPEGCSGSAAKNVEVQVLRPASLSFLALEEYTDITIRSIQKCRENCYYDSEYLEQNHQTVDSLKQFTVFK